MRQTMCKKVCSICIYFFLMFFLSACETKNENIPPYLVDTKPLTEQTLTNLCSMKSLPPYIPIKEPERQYDPPFYELTEDGILRHEIEYQYGEDTLTKHYRNTLIDFDGNEITRTEYEPAEMNFGRSILTRDGILFARTEPLIHPSAELVLSLTDASGTVLAEYPDFNNQFGQWSNYRAAGDHYFVLEFNSFYVFDAELNLLLAEEIPNEICFMEPVEVYPYGDDHFILRYAMPVDARENARNDPGVRKSTNCFDRYFVYSYTNGFERELVPALPERTNQKELPGILYLFGKDSSETAYSVTEEGITRLDGENDGEGTLVCDFSASDLNPSRIQVLMVLPGERFLAHYTDPLTEETTAVILVRQPETVSHAKTVKTAVIGLNKQNGYKLIEDAAYVFNQTQEDYRIELTPYSLNDSIFTPEINLGLGQFERDMVNGAEYDMIVFGLCPNDVNAIDLYDSLAEKQVFRDLSGFAAGCGIMQSVADCYTSFGKVDSLPLMLWYTAMYTTGKESGGNIGLARLTEETQALGEGDLYVPRSTDLKNLRQTGYCSFYRKEEKTCTYDSPEFLEFLFCLDRLKGRTTRLKDETENDSSVRLRQMLDGTLSYDFLEGLGVEMLSQFFAVIGDTPYTFCGLPMLPDGVSVRGDITAAVMKNAVCPDGAEAFLSFLYSDRIQTCRAMLHVGLPVTESALRAVLPVGYNYYTTQTGKLQYFRHQDTPLSDYMIRNDNLEEVYLSEEQFGTWLDYISHAVLYREGGDKTILSIIEEEVSAADAGVRTRAEAAKIIQNRVMLYLNE